MTEFWEKNFTEKKEMWGFEPAHSAVITKDLFVAHSIKNVLIPGIGYGRNAHIFTEAGMSVTGIEISKTAIELARKHYGTDITIYHGSVTDMPFDDKKYDGIFCHALIHLLDRRERARLIHHCYNQLTEHGYMVFTAITKQAPHYGKGTKIDTDTYEFHTGAPIFYYDTESVRSEFESAGLFEISEVNENQPMFLIQCKKTT